MKSSSKVSRFSVYRLTIVLMVSETRLNIVLMVFKHRLTIVLIVVNTLFKHRFKGV